MQLIHLLPLLAAAAPALAATTSYPVPTYSTIEPSLTAIEAAAATAVVGEPTSGVSGKVFDRFVQIWLENTDYDKAFDQADLAWLAERGILLENYFSITHPSEPNYVAAVGGSNFGINGDPFVRIPSNISHVGDLLDSKGISWAEYQEHAPYAGFQGFNYSNQETYANDYVRKHNPLIIYDNVADNDTRLSYIKNFTSFEFDLAAEKLPQWSFITPNMTNDGHDTTVDVSGSWSRSFLEPLLSNEYFMNNTLVILTFDENESYAIQNRVLAILLGGVVDDSLKNTTDSTFYNHFSLISTVEANWDLPHLGRGDVDANVFKIVADAVGISNDETIDVSAIYNNETVYGFFSDDLMSIPAPNITATNMNGQTVLPSISSVWAKQFAAQESAVSAAATTSASASSSVATSSANHTSAAASSTVAASSTSAAASATSSSAVGVLAPATGLAAFFAVLVALF
ncbi:phosphoesterase family-domain-containing protein [Dipodascopsis tothii]|uniref:phosphoesterase family-domain-containing protein n=1 Tax=Dipodascopsis tothii TaxID=44089 RepID=UPI0034CF1E56